jgi:hypothetical protein
MPAKKGKVEQVPPGNDSPKGVYMFVVVVVVVVVVVERERERERERESYLLFARAGLFLTHLCCEQMTTKTKRTMTKMLSSLS